MRIIGLTGGIASGKSTVSAILRQEGAYIIDTDKIAHDITLPHKPAWYEIVEYFGQEILYGDGTINRRALGQKVFNNQIQRAVLERITHPKIKNKVNEEITIAKQQLFDVVVLDVPLLIEVGWENIVDEVWVVYVDKKTQLSRLMVRNNFTRKQALARISAQMDLTEKARHADVVIDNSGNIEATKAQVLEALYRTCERS